MATTMRVSRCNLGRPVSPPSALAATQGGTALLACLSTLTAEGLFISQRAKLHSFDVRTSDHTSYRRFCCSDRSLNWQYFVRARRKRRLCRVAGGRKACGAGGRGGVLGRRNRLGRVPPGVTVQWPGFRVRTRNCVAGPPAGFAQLRTGNGTRTIAARPGAAARCLGLLPELKRLAETLSRRWQPDGSLSLPGT